MFESDEDAQAYFEKKLEQIKKIRIRQKHPRKPKLSNDPIARKVRHENPIQVDSRNDDVYTMTHRDHHREMERIEANVGRYPTGYRHFENYEFYSL